MHTALAVENGVNLKPYNTFGLPCVAQTLVRIRSEGDVKRVVNDRELGPARKFILGGGSNLVFTQDIKAVVLKVEIEGIRLLETRDDAWIVEAGAGETWHKVVSWCLDQGLPGLENMALIPGTVGAAPVQNIGAYGLELKDRFESLDAVDLMTGRTVTFNREQCQFDYRDSIFKQALNGCHGPARRISRTPGLARNLPRWEDWSRRHATWLRRCDAFAGASCPTRPSSATPAASSRTRWSRPSNVATSSSVTPKSCTTPCPTAASNSPPAG